jgi:hypothetical protein
MTPRARARGVCRLASTLTRSRSVTFRCLSVGLYDLSLTGGLAACYCSIRSVGSATETGERMVVVDAVVVVVYDDD